MMPLRSTITAQRNWWDFLHPALDAASILAALTITKLVARGWVDDAALAMGLVAVVVFLLVSQLSGLNRRFEAGNVDKEITSVIGTWGLTVLVLALLGFATRYSEMFARSVMLAWIILAPALIGLSRMCLRVIQRGLQDRAPDAPSAMVGMGHHVFDQTIGPPGKGDIGQEMQRRHAEDVARALSPKNGRAGMAEHGVKRLGRYLFGPLRECDVEP